jgi:hypothetical protein
MSLCLTLKVELGIIKRTIHFANHNFGETSNIATLSNLFTAVVLALFVGFAQASQTKGVELVDLMPTVEEQPIADNVIATAKEILANVSRTADNPKFSYDGDAYTLINGSGRVTGFSDGKNSFEFRRIGDPVSKRDYIAVVNSDGETVLIQSIEALTPFIPSVQRDFIAGLPVEARSLPVARADVVRYEQAVRARQGDLAGYRKTGPIYFDKSICLDGCDGQRDADNATCDAIFDVALAFATTIGALSTEVADARARALGYGTAGSIALIGAFRRANCKVGAIVGWQACRASC